MKIDIHEARDLAVKLFGLYCIVSFVLLAPQILSVAALSPAHSELITSRLVFAVTTSIPAVLYLALGWTLLFRTRSVVRILWRDVTESDSAPPFSASSLSFWITLIGLFYFIRSVSGLATQLWIFGTRTGALGHSFSSLRFLPDLVIFPLALLFIFKARAIEEFIRRKTHPTDRSSLQ